MKLINDCLTGIDGESYDPSRVYLLIGVLAFLAFQGYAIFKGQSFDPSAFGIGFGGVLAAGGLGIKLKSHTEPGQT